MALPEAFIVIFFFDSVIAIIAKGVQAHVIILVTVALPRFGLSGFQGFNLFDECSKVLFRHSDHAINLFSNSISLTFGLTISTAFVFVVALIIRSFPPLGALVSVLLFLKAVSGFVAWFAAVVTLGLVAVRLGVAIAFAIAFLLAFAGALIGVALSLAFVGVGIQLLGQLVSLVKEGEVFNSLIQAFKGRILLTLGQHNDLPTCRFGIVKDVQEFILFQGFGKIIHCVQVTRLNWKVPVPRIDLQEPCFEGFRIILTHRPNMVLKVPGLGPH